VAVNYRPVNLTLSRTTATTTIPGFPFTIYYTTGTYGLKVTVSPNNIEGRTVTLMRRINSSIQRVAPEYYATGTTGTFVFSTATIVNGSADFTITTTNTNYITGNSFYVDFVGDLINSTSTSTVEVLGISQPQTAPPLALTISTTSTTRTNNIWNPPAFVITGTSTSTYYEGKVITLYRFGASGSVPGLGSIFTAITTGTFSGGKVTFPEFQSASNYGQWNIAFTEEWDPNNLTERSNFVTVNYSIQS
jgi:hypothetical protein